MYTQYLEKVYDPKVYRFNIREMKDKIVKFKKKNKFDTIAFSGHSGAAYAYPLSVQLKCDLICIRKSKTARYDAKFEGNEDCQNYIIVDDCIDTGVTVKRIQKEISKHSPQANLQAIFLYDALPYKNVFYKKYITVPVFRNKF